MGKWSMAKKGEVQITFILLACQEEFVTAIVLPR